MGWTPAVIRISLALVLVTVVYQHVIWFAEWNRSMAGFIPFFIFPILAQLALMISLARSGNAQVFKLASGATIVGLSYGAGVFFALYMTLILIGGGQAPPLFLDQMEQLRPLAEAGDEAAAAQLAQLEGLTPMGFTVLSSIQNAVMGIVMGLIAALVTWIIVLVAAKRRP